MKFLIGINLTVLSLILVGCGLALWEKYPQDNIVEEVAEEVVKAKTGLDIDFSPQTPESHGF